MDFLVSRAKDLQWRIIRGSAIVLCFQNWSWQRCKHRRYRIVRTLRWKEYQYDIAIDLAAPFHRGSLAGAMMSKGVYHWMYIYLIPLGLIVLNAVTQAMNVAEEKSGGTPSAGGQAQQPAVVQSSMCPVLLYNERPGLFTCCK